MKTHNKIRCRIKGRQEARARRTEEQSYKKDPNKFASNLFKGPQNNGAPKFSKEEAQDYFTKTYHDTDRGYHYNPIPDFPIPKKAPIMFSTRCPTLKQLRRSIRRKRNKAAPGFDMLSYVPFKKCVALMEFVHVIAIKVWPTQDVQRVGH